VARSSAATSARSSAFADIRSERPARFKEEFLGLSTRASGRIQSQSADERLHLLIDVVLFLLAHTAR
jgi:hypothetical protein